MCWGVLSIKKDRNNYSYKNIKHINNGNFNDELGKIRKISTDYLTWDDKILYSSELEMEILDICYRFDPKTRKIVEYSSILEADNEKKQEEDYPYYSTDIIYDTYNLAHKSRFLQLIDGGCSCTFSLILDGVFKGKYFVRELYWEYSSYKYVLFDSFSDFLLYLMKTNTNLFNY
jgi:hypothetical protein